MLLFFVCTDFPSCLDRCVEHNIHVLNLPAHTTHLLQVADIAVFGPFKKYISKSLAAYRDQHGTYIPPRYYAAATRTAWEHATSRSNCIAGFEKAGIFPADRTKITPDIYKQGVLVRQLYDDSSRYAPPPAPHVPAPLLDSLSSAAALASPLPPSVEPVSSILSPPALHVNPAPTAQRRVGIPTQFARVLTSEQSMIIIRERQEEKEKKEREKKERKRVKEEKKTAAAQKPKPQPKARKGVTLGQRKPLRDITNTTSTSSNDITDPYDFSTNIGSL